MADFFFSPQTRATYAPSADNLNVSMDFNASPSGTARGTEVVIPNNASPAVRAAANQYNQLVASFAAKHGIGDYPVRGVRTRAENQRGVRNTVHTEPFFNTDLDMQRAIQQNPSEFASLYQSAFGQIPNARVIAPHGVGRDRGAASEIFGDETSFGEFIANTALGQDYTLPATQQQVSSRGAPQMATQPPQSRGAEVMQGLLGQMGMQRQDPSAQGDTAQPFYQRRKFADTMGNMAIAFNSLTQRPDKNLAASIMARREQRNELDKENRQRTEAQNRTNRTVEWLSRQAGGERFAGLVDSVGAAGALQAYQADAERARRSAAAEAELARGEIREVDGSLVRVMRDGAVQEIYGGDQGPDVSDVSNLRKEFTGLSEIKDFQPIARQYANIVSAASTGTGPADITLVFSYMKLIDPTSSVQQGEEATARSAGGTSAQLRGLYNSLLGQGSLDAVTRDQFVAAATDIYNNAKSPYDQAVEYYTGLSTQLGYDPAQVIGFDRGYGGSPYVPAAPPPLSTTAITSGVTQELWDKMTPEERSTF